MAHLFKHPFTAMITGGTSSGKTYWIKKLLLNIDRMSDPVINKILYCYGELNPTILEYYKNDKIITKKGIPTNEEILQLAEKNNLLVILDDLLYDASATFLNNLFTRGSHNWNVSVMLVSQHLFTKQTIVARSNSHYFILMRNPSGLLQIRTLGSQLFPGKLNYFMDVYKDCTSKLYSYLLIDMHPQTSEDMRIKTSIFPQEKMLSYRPK